jgi:hypothetical protein
VTDVPSKSEKQYKFMLAASRDAEFAEEANIKQSVAQEWVYSDMELAAEDEEHAKLIGVTQQEAEQYLSTHSKPSKESRPPSSEW